MNTIQELNELKEETRILSKNARDAKAGVDSLLRQRERLKARLFNKHRFNATVKDAEMKGKADTELAEFDKLLDAAELEFSDKWSEYETHKIHIELLRGYNSTKRAELQQGI
jgi:hypothetical protein